MRKKILAIVFVLTVVLGVLPISANAEETQVYAEETLAVIGDTEYTDLVEALRAATESNPCKVVKNFETDQQIQLSTPIYLDLNGYTVTWNKSGSYFIYNTTSDIQVYNGTLACNAGCENLIFSTKGTVTLTNLTMQGFPSIDGGSLKLKNVTAKSVYARGPMDETVETIIQGTVTVQEHADFHKLRVEEDASLIAEWMSVSSEIERTALINKGSITVHKKLDCCRLDVTNSGTMTLTEGVGMADSEPIITNQSDAVLSIGISIPSAMTINNAGTMNFVGDVNSAANICNTGIINNSGALINSGSIINNGTIANSGTIGGSGSVSGNEALQVVPYLDADGKQQYCTDSISVTSDTKTWNTGWYVVDSDVSISGRINVSGDVKLILADNKTLTAQNGITVEGTNSLTIYGQTAGTGKLIAKGGWRTSAIGGKENYSGGTITINGGVIEAHGGYDAAGIGGGRLGDGGNITINGGNVTATSGGWAAGIGGGYSGSGGMIIINNGTVNASCTGTYGYGSGIGSGGINGSSKTNDGTVIINGGSITATNDKKGAGIGGGNNFTSGTVQISGGIINAHGGKVQIGGRDGASGPITITGGTFNYDVISLIDKTNYNAIDNNDESFSVIKVTPVSIEGQDVTLDYTLGGMTIDVSQYFTINGASGPVSYALTSGSAGLQGSTLTISSPGTYQVRLQTAATEQYGVGEKTISINITAEGVLLDITDLSTNEKIEILVDYTDTVANIKELIQEKAGYSPEIQILTYGFNLLNDEEFLQDYISSNKASLYLIPTREQFTEEQSQKILDAATNAIGCVYVYGMAGPKVFDTTGLIYYVFKQAGISWNKTFIRNISTADAFLKEYGFTVEYQTMDYMQENGRFAGDPKPGDIIVLYSNEAYQDDASNSVSDAEHASWDMMAVYSGRKDGVDMAIGIGGPGQVVEEFAIKDKTINNGGTIYSVAVYSGQKYWSTDESNHWYEWPDENGIISDKAPHRFGNDNVCETCGYVDYTILSGENSSYQKETDGSITVRANGDFKKFIGVKIDGILIDNCNYTAVSGSTIITLKPEFLNTLSVGNHTMTIMYSDGAASTQFTIIADQASGGAGESTGTTTLLTKNQRLEQTNPVTGDGSNPEVWILLLLLGIFGMLGHLIYKTEKNRKIS